MKVLFVITGFGYGDTIRMKALIDELRPRTKNLRIMILGYDHSYNYFHKKYLTLKMGGYNFPDYKLHFKPLPFVLKNLLLPTKWAHAWMKHRSTIIRFDPDVVVSDFEPIANIIGKKIRKPVISVFAYDPELFKSYPKKTSVLKLQAEYLNKLYKQSNHVFIPSFTKHYSKGTLHYIPPLIKRIPSQLPSEVALMKKLKLKKKPVLVMLGGSNYGVYLAQRIRDCLPQFNEEFIFFGSTKTIAAHHYKFKNNFLEYLKVAKALITLGGNLTLTEGLAFKKPMLVFPIKDHVEQTLNTYALREYIMEGDAEHPERSITQFLKNIKLYQEKVSTYHAPSNGAKFLADYLLENYS